ncbi:MAG: pilus assembly protein N-terminal domain-containing protein [Siculibacillus sp.]|nr:pilus assembly protein N-terminal domain-containing protein [Siculibacillus sp.]
MRLSSSVAISFALVTAICGPAAAKDPIAVTVDIAKVMRISAPATTVVLGNPGIADATMQDRQTLVITGKTAGITNLVVLDAKGQLIADEMIHVVKPQTGYVTVQRGGSRYSYACTPHCTPTIEPGDEKGYFEAADDHLRKRIQFGQQNAGTP